MPALTRLRLIHWHPTEAVERIRLLEGLDCIVQYEPFTPALLRAFKKDPPDAFLIDLSRLPSQGRDVAVQIRQSKALDPVPILFLGGDLEKLGRIRELLPASVFTTWDQIQTSLPLALASPPLIRDHPTSNFAAYAGVPLAQKLGIRPGSTVRLIGAPDDFEQTLSALPAGVCLTRETNPPPDLIMWFPQDRSDLETRILEIRGQLGKDGLWILWQKKSSGIASDLNQVVVRKLGLAHGLVDYKISSIDSVWSGLRFALRKGGTNGTLEPNP